MTDCQEALLKLLSKALFNRNREVSVADSVALLNEAKHQAVVQLAFSALDTDRLPEDAFQQWQKYTMQCASKNLRVIHKHALLHKWLSAAGIPYVILKGCASAAYYPQPDARAMGDVDFLVAEEDLERAGKVLEEHGLKPWEFEHISHIVYQTKSANGINLEMHFNLAGLPAGESGELVRACFRDVYTAASVRPIGDGQAVLPSPFHHGLVLLLHTCHHMTGEGIGLRHLCDWAVFANRFSDDEFRSLFEQPLKRIGLWKFAQTLTRVSIKYLGASEKDWAVCDERLADSLMEDILLGGNFGKKDNNRGMQTLLISDRGKNGVGRTGMLHQLVRSTNAIILLNWPKARKYKLLLPVGWIYWGFRRMLRELTGKRKKSDVKQVLTGAASRRKLYQQLGLYDRENQAE